MKICYPGSANWSTEVECCLAIDTSTRNVGIAVYDGIQVLSETVWASQDYHTVELAPAIASTLSRLRL